MSVSFKGLCGTYHMEVSEKDMAGGEETCVGRRDGEVGVSEPKNHYVLLFESYRVQQPFKWLFFFTIDTTKFELNLPKIEVDPSFFQCMAERDAVLVLQYLVMLTYVRCTI